MATTTSAAGPDGLLARAQRECRRANYGFALHLFTLAATEETIDAFPPRALSACARALAECHEDRLQDAIGLCRLAIARDADDPRLYDTLAHLYVRAGRKPEALHTLELALRYHPRSRILVNRRAALGHRAPAVFGFLPRAHPLNRWVGRIRHRLTTRAGD